MTSIRQSGYAVPKSSLSTAVLEQIRSALTVKPINMMEEYLSKPQDTSFEVFEETDDMIYVPKAYGLRYHGVPGIVDLSEGDDIDVAFQGELRPAQEESAKAFMDALVDPTRMGGIINLACAGGKTVIALNIISRLKKKTIIVCHKEFLIDQWRERIAQFLPTARVGIIKAKLCDADGKDIVLASLQSLSMKQYDPSIFDGFALAVYDECHHTSAAVFSRVFRTASTRYALGLSATLDRKDGLTKVFKWHIGDVVHRQAQSVGPQDDVGVVVVSYLNESPEYCAISTIFGGQKPNTSRMINNICAFEPRTAFLVGCVKQILEDAPTRKVLVLSDRRGHLEEMHRRMTSEGIDAGLYYGGLKQEILKETENRSVMLGTYAYVSEGFDNKDLNTLVLASPKSDIVQVVGRILRTPPNERVHRPLVIDIVDKFSLFPNQARTRLRYFKSQGYETVNVFEGGFVDAVRRYNIL
jgi:superfamily II DNA or RNA helicase